MSGLTTSIYCWWDLYSGRNEHNKDIPIDAVINDLQGSGFTTVIAWSVHVNTSGDLIYNDPPIIVSSGAYVGDPQWPADLATLKQDKTSVNRLLFSVGSDGRSTDFHNIQALIKSQGTGPDSILYKNFKALKEAIPAIDGIDLDDEDLYDQDTIVQFSQMLHTLSYKVTFCPYTQMSFWVECLYALNQSTPGLVVGFNLQCYAGGTGNNPQDWINAIQQKMGSGFDAKGLVYPGLWSRNGDGCSDGECPDSITQQFTTWRPAGIQGGFIWQYDDIQKCKNSGTCSGPMDTAAYASAIVEGLQGTPVYLYTASNPSRYYYTTNPLDTPGEGWTQGGVAFFAFQPGTSGVTAVQQFSAGAPQRFSFGTNTVPAPGWTNDHKTAFYVATSAVAHAVSVYQYHQILSGGFWNMFYSLDAHVAGWTNDGVAFYVSGT